MRDDIPELERLEIIAEESKAGTRKPAAIKKHAMCHSDGASQ